MKLHIGSIFGTLILIVMIHDILLFDKDYSIFVIISVIFDLLTEQLTQILACCSFQLDFFGQ